MKNEKKYLMVIFNEKDNSHYIYVELSEIDCSDIKDILDFLDVPYTIGEIIENTYKEK